MPGPFTSDVHVPRPLSPEDREKLKASVAKTAAQPLYVYRPVVNAAEIIRWAKEQGFKTTRPAEDLHVTVTYSKAPVDWMAMGENWSGDGNGNYTVEPGGPRQVEPLGEKATVLLFASSMLGYRHQSMVEAGASWDYAEYQPHVTLSYDIGDLDLSTVEPFRGKIVLGPEVFEPIDDNWSDEIVEKKDAGPFEVFCKVERVDEELGLVFGWAIVCKDEDGKDYWDVQKNHIPEKAMVKATTDFMKNSRGAGDMHSRMGAGTVVHSFPMAGDIAKSLGIITKKTGWLVAMAPDAAMLAKFKSGEYTGFSIGGEHITLEEVA